LALPVEANSPSARAVVPAEQAEERIAAVRQAWKLEDSEFEERLGLAALGFSGPALVGKIRELHTRSASGNSSLL